MIMWFFKKKKETEQDMQVKRIKAEQLDMQGLFSNINKRAEIEALYKELCKLCHPDKFEYDSESQNIAKELFEKVQNCRNNYNSLIRLKSIIEEKLLKSE